MMELMAKATPSMDRWVTRASRLLKHGLWAENSGAKRRDRRAEPRLRINFLARISGESGSRGVRGVNFHSGGALLLAKQPMAPESVILFHAKSFGLMGFAQVRHCAQQGVNAYAIGVAFPSPLMRDDIGTWEFHRVRPNETGWSMEMAASMNLSPAVRASAEVVNALGTQPAPA